MKEISILFGGEAGEEVKQAVAGKTYLTNTWKGWHGSDAKDNPV